MISEEAMKEKKTALDGRLSVDIRGSRRSLASVSGPGGVPISQRRLDMQPVSQHSLQQVPQVLHET